MSQEYVGLRNLGATCYLNSLLQSLFMTPDFREALFKWEPKPGCALATELRRLFGRMHLLAPVIDTAGVTKALAWGDFANFQQHDAQEFFGVLFDRLEQQSPDLWKSLAPLYTLAAEDYVKCSTCLRVSNRSASLLDLPLSVPEHDSLPSAIAGFLAAELMCGDEQYACDNCGVKRDAKRGSKLCKLPPVLVFTLKRFQFAADQGQGGDVRRRKLNNRMTFPLVLDMNGFIGDRPAPSAVLERHDSQTQPVLTLNSATSQIQKYLCDRGSEVYELFSVLVHSGNAQGGHYYALVKDLDKDKWICFDDDSVSILESADRLERVWGGDCAANAYILKYRRVGDRPAFPSEAPADIQKEVEALRKAEAERRAKRRTRILVRRVEDAEKAHFEIEVDESQTVLSLFQAILTKVDLFYLSPDKVRLRKFLPSTKTWNNTVMQTYSDLSDEVRVKSFMDSVGFKSVTVTGTPGSTGMFSLKRAESCFNQSAHLKDTFLFNTGMSRQGLICEVVLEIAEQGPLKSLKLSNGHRLIFAKQWSDALGAPEEQRKPCWIPEGTNAPLNALCYRIANEIGFDCVAPRALRAPADSLSFVTRLDGPELTTVAQIGIGETIIVCPAASVDKAKEYLLAKETCIKISFNSSPAANSELPPLDQQLEVAPETEIAELLAMLGVDAVEARLLPPERSVIAQKSRVGEVLRSGKLGDYVNEKRRSKREASIVLWRE